MAKKLNMYEESTEIPKSWIIANSGKITATISKDKKTVTYNIKLQGTKKKNWIQRWFNI